MLIETPLALAAHNNARTNNLATLSAHVATRLPRAWYFSATDIELTVNAVVLLRITFAHLAATCAPAELRAHLSTLPNPGATPNAEVRGGASACSARWRYLLACRCSPRRWTGWASTV